MPLDFNMMNASVRIIGDVPDRSKLGFHRGPIGTGFMVAVPSEADPASRYGYVVTAHHVLDGQTHVEVQVPDPRTIEREDLLDPVEVTDWRQPLERVDLALAPFVSTVDADEKTLTAAVPVDTHFLPAKYVPPLGGSIYYIGFFEPLKRAMARSGNLGALFQTGIEHDGDYEYPSHLVDCRSYNGFSGSPCYVKYSFAKTEPTKDFPFPMHSTLEKEFPLAALLDLTLLCGMFTEHIEERTQTPGEAVSKYGVGIMLPSLFIWMALYHKSLVEERRELDKVNEDELSKDQPKVKKASIRPEQASPSDEFERFEELARELANTPKQVEDDAQ